MRTGIKSTGDEAYFREEAKEFKKQLQTPIILVGGIRSFEVAEKLVEEGYTDYVSMSRPLIIEPDLIARWRSGNRERSRCVSDNHCLSSAISGGGFYCVAEEKRKKHSG